MLALAAAWAAPGEARANGRFPRAERLIEDPSNPNHLILAATYGLVTTTDRGQHWFHICEADFAADGTYQGDPLLELVSGGAWLVDVQSQIRRSADGCAWKSTFGSSGATNQNVNDLAVASPARTTIVGVVTSVGDGGTSIGLQQSDDAGMTWHPVGSPLPLSTVATIDLDPSDPTHIYASGLLPAKAGAGGALLKSTDHGATWTSTPIPNTDADNVPYIAAIGTSNEIFVRTDSFILPDGACEESANDALLYSKDGGASWSELLRESAKLLGFAFSPDGSTILAGYGNPVESGYSVDDSQIGIYSATRAGGLSFSKVYGGASVTGLTWTSSGVYVGSAMPASGTRDELLFFSGGSISTTGAAPTALMALNAVQGPPPCCAGIGATCDWSSVCMTYPFFSCTDAGLAPATCDDGGAAAVDAADAMGGKMDTGVAGAGGPDANGSSADGSVADASGGDLVPLDTASSGCRCELGGARSRVNGRDVAWGMRGVAWAFSWALGALTLRRVRKRKAWRSREKSGES